MAREVARAAAAVCFVATAVWSAFAGAVEPIGKQIEVGAGSEPAIATASGGAFEIVWRAGATIYGRHFSIDGRPTRLPVQIGRGLSPALAWVNDHYMVTWNSGGRIVVRRLDPSGAPIGPERQASQSGGGSAFSPSISSLANGNFVIAWAGRGVSTEGVFFQLFGPGGGKIGQTRLVSSDAAQTDHPAVSSLPSGEIVVVWDSHNGEVTGQVFSSSGARIGDTMQFGSGNNGSSPEVAGIGDRIFAVVWQEGEKVVFSTCWITNGCSGGLIRWQPTRQPAIAPLPGNGFVAAGVGRGPSGSDIFGYVRASSELTVFRMNQAVEQSQTMPSLAARGARGIVAAWASSAGVTAKIQAQQFRIEE